MIAPSTIIWAKVDISNSIALITGKSTEGVVFEVAPQARWSRSGRGWVVTLDQLADIATICDHRRIPYRERAA